MLLLAILDRQDWVQHDLGIPGLSRSLLRIWIDSMVVVLVCIHTSDTPPIRLERIAIPHTKQGLLHDAS
jgi:hypothetical protein